MAKKAQIQLQTEVSSEEEWTKLLDKRGLIVCDIYSEWAGPCVWMVPFLRKVKMDVLGDNLTLALVNSETVRCLSRFKGRSEPTWMFIRNGKMLSVMFGTNAPKLMEMMNAELRNDQAGRVTDEGLDFEELTPEEDVRFQREQAIAKEEARIKQEVARRAFNEFRLQQCKYLLETLNHIGIIFFYPHVGNDGMAAVSEEWDGLGLIVFNISRIQLTDESLEDLMWFEEEPIPEEAVQVLKTHGQTLALLVKPLGEDEDFDQDVDKLVLQAAYGKMRKPPGDPECPARKVFRAAEDGGPMVPGMWAPSNQLTKAMALEVFFPEVCATHRMPDVEPPPPLIAVIFDARKRQEALEVQKEFPTEILHYGFFTSADPQKATLIAKTVEEYQSTPGASLADKLVLCVAKKRSDPLLALALQNPVYISSTPEDGEEDCAAFFPENYEAPPEEVKAETPKKKKKQRTSDHKAEESQEVLVETDLGIVGEAGEELPAGEIPPGEELPTGEVPPSAEAPPPGETAPPPGETAPPTVIAPSGEVAPPGEAAPSVPPPPGQVPPVEVPPEQAPIPEVSPAEAPAPEAPPGEAPPPPPPAPIEPPPPPPPAPVEPPPPAEPIAEPPAAEPEAAAAPPADTAAAGDVTPEEASEAPPPE